MKKGPLGAGSPFGNQHHAIILADAPGLPSVLMPLGLTVTDATPQATPCETRLGSEAAANDRGRETQSA